MQLRELQCTQQKANDMHSMKTPSLVWTVSTLGKSHWSLKQTDVLALVFQTPKINQLIMFLCQKPLGRFCSTPKITEAMPRQRALPVALYVVLSPTSPPHLLHLLTPQGVGRTSFSVTSCRRIISPLSKARSKKGDIIFWPPYAPCFCLLRWGRMGCVCLAAASSAPC